MALGERHLGPRINRTEGRRGNRGLHLLADGLLVIATLATLNALYNGVEFGHWDPFYAQPVISK